MKTRLNPISLSLIALLTATAASPAAVILGDTVSVTGSGTGFALNAGVNTGINPPTTRLTGSANANVRYIATDTSKAASAYSIAAQKIAVASAANSGRFTFSTDGSTAMDFASLLGSTLASPTNPSIYEVTISMNNNSGGTQRFSFALSTTENNANFWDFGLQVYRAAGANTFYTFQKRIDRASWTTNTDSTGTTDDINDPITTASPNTFGTDVSFLIRVTDAGAETGTNFHSRLQISTNNGSSFFYDTASDSTLTNGWRFDGASRFIIHDIAASAVATYDNFSLNLVSGPAVTSRIWNGGGTDNNWSTPANWGGTAPSSGEVIIFDGTNRQTNTNDLTNLSVPVTLFTTGGFSLYGNTFTNTVTLSNSAGINILNNNLVWGSTSAKTWSIASGSELQLNNTTTIDVNGDNTLIAGGTLHVLGALNIGQASSATPAFILNEGKLVVDGGTFASRGGFRIGSFTGGTGCETIVSNGVFNLTVAGANLRVGDAAFSGGTNRLTLTNSTLTMSGGSLAIPYQAGGTSQVSQAGGTVSGCIVNFSQNGAGHGTYVLQNGRLSTWQIKKTTSGSQARMYFDGAVLVAPSGASNAFFTGINTAQILSGGLTVDSSVDITIGQALSGTGDLVKSNFGALTMTANNSYTGDTFVRGGKLIFPTTQTNTTDIVVDDGLEFGVQVRASGSSLSASSLTFSGPSFNTLSFDLSTFATPSAPLMKVDTLTVNGPVTINVANGVQLAVGQITLVDYTNLVGGFTFTLGSLPPGVVANLVDNTANSSVDLNITAVPGLRWTGATDNNWDYSTINWIDKQTMAPSAYADGYPLEFLDVLSNNLINLSAFPVPTLIVVSNNAVPFSWTGGAITVPIIKKSGTNSLTRVETSADLITTIELNEGSFIASNTFNATFSTLLTDTTPGNGTFVKAGASTLTVSAPSSTYDGAVIIQEGTLKMATNRALGSTSSTTTIASGATLDLNDFSPGFEPVRASGAGVGGIGAIIDSTATGTVDANLQDVTLLGDTTFGCPNNGRWDIRVRSGTGPGPGLQGNGFNLTKVGSGLVSIACQRNIGVGTPYWDMNLGDVTVNGGTIAFAESLKLGNPAKIITVNPSAILQFYDLGYTNPMPRSIFMTDARLNFSGNDTDTNILTGPITLTNANTIYVDQAAAFMNGPVGGAGSFGIFANGPGRIYFNATNTYPGDTTVTNATIGGSGVLAGNLVMLGGTNSPGYGIGTLRVNGNATLAGTTLMEVNRNLTPNSDQLSVGGSIAFGGILQVKLGAGAPQPQGGDVYQIFNKAGSGSFSSIFLPTLSGGLSWITTNLTINGSISVSGASSPTTITNVVNSGGNLIFSGTGGTAGSSYVVVSSADVSLPMASWTPVATNTFGPGGSFSVTNAINLATPATFLRIRVP